MPFVIFARTFVRHGVIASLLFLNCSHAWAKASCTVAGDHKVTQAVQLLNDKSTKGHKVTMSLLLDASRLGNADAYFNLGLIHMRGLGVPANSSAAVPFFRFASECGILEAQVNLAQLLLDMPDGKAEAASWFKIAADNGSRVAAYNVGLMYYKSLGVRKNTNLAIKYLNIAASAGHIGAMYNLGYI